MSFAENSARNDARLRPGVARSAPHTVRKVHWSPALKRFQSKVKKDDRWISVAVPVEHGGDESHLESAQAWFNEHARQHYLNQDVAPVEVGVHTVRTLHQRWLDLKLKEGDAKAHGGLRSFVKHWIKPHRIYDIGLAEELSLADCVAWVKWVKSKGRAPYTNRNIVQTLRMLISDAEGEGWIAENPKKPLNHDYIKKVLGPMEPVAGHGTIIALTSKQVKQFVVAANLDPMRHVRYVLALATGMRLAELCALTFDDVDLDSKVPTVKVFRQLVLKKGGPGFKKPKRNSSRVVPLHPTALQALRWWKAKGWSLHVGKEPSGESPIFPEPGGNFAMLRVSHRTQLDLALAGLPIVFDGVHPITFQALRRTFMSMLNEAGVQFEHIRALAGHSSKGVTDKHYVQKNIKRFHTEIKKLPLPKVLPWAK